MATYRVPVTNAHTAKTLSIEVEAASAGDAAYAALVGAFRQHGWHSCRSHPDLAEEVRYTCLTCGCDLATAAVYFCPPCLAWALRQQMALHLGDAVELMDRIETDSVGLTVTSPPFPGMYAYTNSMRDMGNCRDIDEMLAHFRFLVGKEKLWRVTMPGRMACLHLTQAPIFKHLDGHVGLADFRGRVIQMMVDEGWIYYGEVTIDKNPQLKAQRTKERGLLFKTLAADSSHMRMAMADYLIYFRKPGDNPQPIKAGSSAQYGNEDGWITNDEWIEWAAPVWYRKTPDYPGGISETDVLPVSMAREQDDEKHLCPLQLGVIERAVKLWSAPGDLVCDPFAGIGSTGFEVLRLGRRFVGVELKQTYFDVACRNLREAERQQAQPDLFSVLGGTAS